MRPLAAFLLGVAVVAAAATGAAGVGNPVPGLAAQAQEHYQKGRYSEALGLYREALLQDPRSARLHFNAGNALYRMQDYEAAAREYAAALQETDPTVRSQTLYNIGNARFQQQRYDQAAEAYQQALELASADQDAKANLELALRRLQEQRQEQQQGGQQQDRRQDRQGQQDQKSQTEQGDRQPPKDREKPDDQQGDQEDRQQSGQQDQQGAAAERPERQEGPQAGAAPGRRMSREEAERVLQALRDRELQGRLRRTPVPADRPEKDW